MAWQLGSEGHSPSARGIYCWWRLLSNGSISALIEHCSVRFTGRLPERLVSQWGAVLAVNCS